MKRSVFIIIGVVLIVLLIGIWVYVLFFGSPENAPDNFADLNFGDTTDTNLPINQPTNTEPVVDVGGAEALRQLTTKPIAGYQEVVSGGGLIAEVLYIEAGTGHIFAIDTESGEEERVSATTIPFTQSGVITPTGNHVFIQALNNGSREFLIGTLSSTSDTLEITKLAEEVVDYKATTDNTFLYAVQGNNSVIGKEYDPVRHTSETLFTIPFREAAISWGETADDTHYTHPKASNRLEGFGYKITSRGLERLPIDGYGFSMIGTDDFVLFGRQAGQVYENGLYDIENEEFLPFLIETIPEKCVFTSVASTSIICGGVSSGIGINMPDVWYRGETEFVDNIWEIDTESLTATVLANPVLQSGRELDVTTITIGNENTIYFINKNDQTLWLLDTSIE